MLFADGQSMSEGFPRPIEKKILEALAYYRRADLARLLANSSYDLDISTTYGRAYNAYKTGVQLFSNIGTHEKLEKLSDQDKDNILRAFQVVHPLKSGELDLCWLETYIDPKLPIPSGSPIRLKLSDLNLSYITEQIEKCDTKLTTGDYEGALTNARSLLEAVLKLILDEATVAYDESEDLLKLYRKVATLLKMNPADYANDSFKKILSGFFSIVQGISELRNAFSDAHGRSGKVRYRLEARHAKLAVDSVKTIAEFVFRSYTENKQ